MKNKKVNKNVIVNFSTHKTYITLLHFYLHYCKMVRNSIYIYKFYCFTIIIY